MKSKLQFFKISDFERWHIHNTLTWAKIMNSNSFESPYPWWFPGLLVKNIVVVLRYIIPSQRALTPFYKRKSDRSVMLLIAWYFSYFSCLQLLFFVLLPLHLEPLNIVTEMVTDYTRMCPNDHLILIIHTTILEDLNLKLLSILSLVSFT